MSTQKRPDRSTCLATGHECNTPEGVACPQRFRAARGTTCYCPAAARCIGVAAGGYSPVVRVVGQEWLPAATSARNSSEQDTGTGRPELVKARPLKDVAWSRWYQYRGDRHLRVPVYLGSLHAQQLPVFPGYACRRPCYEGTIEGFSARCQDWLATRRLLYFTDTGKLAFHQGGWFRRRTAGENPHPPAEEPGSSGAKDDRPLMLQVIRCTECIGVGDYNHNVKSQDADAHHCRDPPEFAASLLWRCTASPRLCLTKDAPGTRNPQGHLAATCRDPQSTDTLKSTAERGSHDTRKPTGRPVSQAPASELSQGQPRKPRCNTIHGFAREKHDGD
ncbi:hypothetical protein CSUI_007677 [Cystoisospora suis]|uniref:Uncharacterized protein n=1 Tax=Cystoisospora suis TaxID=483139 RepID=A0A2C6KPR2_9APIC|nr:hypothetical protein CSUI_007677 [Cystoisospora suis]